MLEKLNIVTIATQAAKTKAVKDINNFFLDFLGLFSSVNSAKS